MTDYDTFFIDGSHKRATSSERVAITSSIDGHLLGAFPRAMPADVDAAVASARRAIAPGAQWTLLDVEQRATAIESLATALKSQVSALGVLIAEEVGSPIGFATNANAVSAISQLRLYARIAREVDFESIRPARLGSSLVRRIPVGVVAAVVPWNFPISMAINKLGPALAAGCTIVLKPSAETGLSSYLLAEAVAASEIPAGVINIVPADREISEYLVGHPGVDKISFTGSTAAGRKVASLAGLNLKPVTLELGGKSAAVLLPDADLDVFIGQLPALSFMNNGQTCTIDSRILVPQSRANEFTDAIVARVDALKVGSSLDTESEIGPLVSAAQRERVEGYIEIGRSEGARILTVGRRPDGLDDGFFVQPTVFGSVEPGMRIAREEIFGPVVTIQQYADTDDAAVQLANDSEFGLAGTVWSIDQEHAESVARRIESGVVGANVWNLDLGAPFGGRKASGIGHELGPEAVDPYLVYQSIYVPQAPQERQ
ncbi:aldehyde dehydrogenase family protein [Glaciibacter superstes]|uniref:aldehyde dehydrogenase family protein n=1 Tax=Glaciibacter superstes TaxID=501023 RepID=UPI0003B36672|nr:aldehyde dehydrogenase family protein [Glaciibacter superstes]